jgi:predicted NBD/HSP70 family sugar kinase
MEPLHAASELLQCSCSVAQSSHLEAFASATAVVCRVLGKRKQDIELNRWRESLADVVNAAIVDGDDKATRAIEDAGFLLGRQINTLASCLGPERVLVVGALTAAEGLLLGAIHDEIETVRAPMTHAPRDVRFGTRGDAARWVGVNGAARLALERGVWGPTRQIGTQYNWPGLEAAEALVRAAKEKERGRKQAADSEDLQVM